MPRNHAKPESTKSAEKSHVVMSMMPEVDYQSLAQASGSTMQAFMRASDAMLKGVMALSQEMTEFTNARLRQNVERSETMLRCHDPAEAFGLHCDFAHRATRQYLDEANRLMALASEVSGKCWEPLEEATREALDRFGNGKRNGRNGDRHHAEAGHGKR